MPCCGCCSVSTAQLCGSLLYHGRVHRLQRLRRTVDTSSDRTVSDLTTCIRSSSSREERWIRLLRSDVIEEGYKPSERLTAEVESVTSSLPSEVDYIIIGSGIGGLTCGALLRYYGYSVLVLESHYAPGGVAHTFEKSCDRRFSCTNKISTCTRRNETTPRADTNR